VVVGRFGGSDRLITCIKISHNTKYVNQTLIKICNVYFKLISMWYIFHITEGKIICIARCSTINFATKANKFPQRNALPSQVTIQLIPVISISLQTVHINQTCCPT
jgi:hypothetical protein